MKTKAQKENAAGEVHVVPIRGVPEVKPGDVLADLIPKALRSTGQELRAGDILVLKHKIVSKAEGRIVALESVKPSRQALSTAKRNRSDPRVIELALREAKGVLRNEHVLITETHHGFVCANSGVDVSNVDGGRSAVLLPIDPDASSLRIHRNLKKQTNLYIPVIISDSFGRAWREGLCDVAIGVAGMRVTRDYRGRRDVYGYKLHATEEAVADEIAALAGLVTAKNERVPACIIRGYVYQRGAGKARRLVRPTERDLFR